MYCQELEEHIDRSNDVHEESFVVDHPFTNLVRFIRDDDNELEEVRSKATNEMWKEYVELCMEPTINKSRFRLKQKTLPVSGFVTAYDEAFGVLCVENNLEEWIFQALNDGKKGDNLTLYTGKGKKKKGRKKGWSIVGLRRFNTIQERVRVQREEEISKVKEEWIKNVWKGNTISTDDIDGNDDETGIDEDVYKQFFPANGFQLTNVTNIETNRNFTPV